MKKVTGLVVSIVFNYFICLWRKTKTFVGEESNVKMEVTYTYKGDEIIKQKSVNTLKYSDFSLNDDTSKK